MADIVDQQTRSRMMSGIRAKDTKGELLIRSGLHELGFRFRLHATNLPGTPDLVLPRFRAAIFVHGCFWHGHDCHLFKMPSTRREFWQAKIARNVDRDCGVRASLCEAGWRRLVIWECALKGKHRLGREALMRRVSQWIVGRSEEGEIEGLRSV